MDALKRIVLPDYRATGCTYRTDYRAKGYCSRTDYRSYYEQKRDFLGPIIGHYLDKPSVPLKKIGQANDKHKGESSGGGAPASGGCVLFRATRIIRVLPTSPAYQPAVATTAYGLAIPTPVGSDACLGGSRFKNGALTPGYFLTRCRTGETARAPPMKAG